MLQLKEFKWGPSLKWPYKLKNTSAKRKKLNFSIFSSLWMTPQNRNWFSIDRREGPRKLLEEGWRKVRFCRWLLRCRSPWRRLRFRASHRGGTETGSGSQTSKMYTTQTHRDVFDSLELDILYNNCLLVVTEMPLMVPNRNCFLTWFLYNMWYMCAKVNSTALDFRADDFSSVQVFNYNIKIIQ